MRFLLWEEKWNSSFSLHICLCWQTSIWVCPFFIAAFSKEATFNRAVFKKGFSIKHEEITVDFF